VYHNVQVGEFRCVLTTTKMPNEIYHSVRYTHMKMNRASDDVLNRRRILTAKKGGKSVAPPPSQRRSVAAAHSAVPPTSHCASTMPSAETAMASKDLAPQGRRRIVRAVRRRKDVAPPTTPPRPPPPPCETPPPNESSYNKSKKTVIDEHQDTNERTKTLSSCIRWEKSMKAALAYVAMTRSQDKKITN